VNAPIDEATIRQFLEIISAHATQVINGAGPPGVLQLCRINPIDESVVSSRFLLDDVEDMVQTAVGDAEAGHNVYIEARTVRSSLRGKQRGALGDTAWVFGLVADGDADKGKGGNIQVRPSLVIETSPGNFHYWYLLTRAIRANRARVIGEVIRTNSGTDEDTGVITQPYRVPGTPNFPSDAKRKRGRMTVEPTRIVEQTGRLWNPGELLKAFRPAAASSTNGAAASPPGAADETTLPVDLLRDIRKGGVGKGSDASRSALFQSVVGQLKRRHWSCEAIVALFEKYPNGIRAKYGKRLAKEVERSYGKAIGGVSPGASTTVSAAATPASTATGGTAPGATPHTAAAGNVLPTVRLIDGQLPRAVAETERALKVAGTEVFSRAGSLVYPVGEAATSADGSRTVMARLSPFTPDSFLEPVAEAAIFQRFSVRRNAWVDVDPPLQLVRMVLSRERKWTFPRVGGIITTPTLRADGSLLSAPGYDPRSELYLLPSLQLPPIPERPTREQAEAALATLKEVFVEFSFKQKEPAIDRSVVLSGLLTALLRGSLPTSPVYLVRADTPGTGKSYLVDIVAMITTGRLCPVITASRNIEETEKRIGAVLLSGSSIVSLDNVTHDLGGELLCQLTERPIVKIRILGRSEMPECEVHTAVFATGNNIGFQGDMVRRGFVCNLEALSERPELRAFRRDALALASANRSAYVAAALTIVRAYLAAGSPRVCGPFGSYAAWSTMVRSPLVWLGEPDPITSMDEIRAEDPELANIREFFELWLDYDLGLDTPYTVARILELACAPLPSSNYNTPWFKDFLLRVAAAKGKEGSVSPERLGWWLRRISGRVVNQHRLMKHRDKASAASFRLVKVP
jgi:RepB DNA-primase from phage plasmid